MKGHWVPFIGVTLLGFVAFLDFTIVNTALPIIQKDLKMSMISLQWIMNIYFLMLAMLMTVGGRLGDIFGHRKLFDLGGIIFLAASLIAGGAFTGEMLIFGRLLQGVGAAMIFPVAASLLNEVFQEKKTRALALYGTVGGMGLALGPILGAFLTQYVNWRAVFLINVPICVTALFLCFFSLKKSPQERKGKIDWIGFILFAIGMGGVVFGIIESAKKGWNDVQTLSSIAIGIISLIALFIVEKKVKEPLIDPSFYKKPLFIIASLSNMSGGIGSAIILFFIPLYLHSIRGAALVLTGLIIFSMTLVYTVFSTQLEKLVKKFSLVGAILLGMVASMLAALFIYPLNLEHSIYFALIPCSFIGITWAIGNILSIVAAQDSAPPEKVGVATGMTYTMFNVGGSIMLAIATVVFRAKEKAYLGASQKDLAILGGYLSDAMKGAFIQGLMGVATVLLIASSLIVLVSFVARGKMR